MRKVLIMSSVHPWDDARIFYRQARSLARRYRVEIHAPGPAGYMEVDGVVVRGLPRVRRFVRPLQWLRLLRSALHSKADCYHLHDPELLPVGVLLRCITRRPVIYDAHENLSLTVRHKKWLPASLRGPAAKMCGWLEKVLAHKVSAVVAATPDIQKYFGVLGINSITVCNYPPPDFACRAGGRKYLPGDDKFNAVYVGGLSVSRGIMDLVKALDQLCGIRLALAGTFFDSEVEQVVKARARQADDLVYLGRLHPGEIPALLGESDAGLICLHPLPNHVRSMPLKLFEYMAAGLPVIASRFPLWESILHENRCGLTVEPGNHQAIAGALEKLAGNRELCRNLGKNGQRAWSAKFNWYGEESKLLSLYRDLGGEA